MVLVEDGGNDARYLVFKLVVEPILGLGEFLGWSQEGMAELVRRAECPVPRDVIVEGEDATLYGQQLCGVDA